jgi:hypothetical protein
MFQEKRTPSRSSASTKSQPDMARKKEEVMQYD